MDNWSWLRSHPGTVENFRSSDLYINTHTEIKEWRKKERGKDGRGAEENKEGKKKGRNEARDGGRKDQIFHSAMLRSYFKSILLSSNQ